MNKKYLSVVLFGALLLGTAGTFTSCKDYDDDIENLQGQITAMKGTVDQLEQKIKDGLVVTKVEKVADGVSITFSNGQTFKLENGAKGDKGDTGATGAAGKDADVWTIGQDGYWYKNDKPTEYVAVPSVTSGTDGRTLFYKPNTETECFDLYEIKDGKEVLVETTNISYVAKNGLSVVHNGNTLIINGAVDGEGNPAGPVTLKLGEELTSIAFVPDMVDGWSAYPLTKFHHVDNFLSEAAYVNTGTLATTKYDFVEQPKYDKSNEVKMTYRVSPQRAYVEGANLSFINRSVEITRAIAGDMTELLNVVSGSEQVNGEQIILNATFDASKTNDIENDDTYDLVALQATVGAELPVTSDYSAVRSYPLDVYLVDTKTQAGAAAAALEKFYDRTKAIVTNTDGTTNESHDFLIANRVPAVAVGAVPTHLQFKYKKDDAGTPGEIDLNKLVGLYGISDDYVNGASDYLSKLGFTGIRYQFSLPNEYLANDANHTNQQWFVKLDENGILRVNAEHLNTGLTPAIGRRPVVRVDAFMKNNAGEEKLVCSSYIRLQIVEYLLEAHDPIQIGAATPEYEYHTDLTDRHIVVGNMAWERINTEIYGVEHLNANTFWANYGGAAKQYNVKISTYQNGQPVTLLSGDLNHDALYTTSAVIPGIYMQVILNESDVTTSCVTVGVDNRVKTQNTYDNINGKGAKYEITITIKANDPTQHSDFKLTQEFYVKDVCQFFNFNPNYYFNTWPGESAGDYIWVRGRLVGGTYKIVSDLPEHFEMVDIDPNAAVDWQNIFGYYKTTASPVKNVAATVNNLKFQWDAQNGTGALPAGEINESTADMTLRLAEDIKKDKEIKQMNYEFELVNGEKCKTSYQVVFTNPFKGADNVQAVTMLDGPAQSAKTAEKVLVKERYAQVEQGILKDLYKWNVDDEELQLTDVAKEAQPYHIEDANVSVTYAWVEDDVYNSFVNNLTNGSHLDLDENTGIVTWANLGAGLSSEKKLTVKATVKFAGISQVEILIPVTIQPINP